MLVWLLNAQCNTVKEEIFVRKYKIRRFLYDQKKVLKVNSTPSFFRDLRKSFDLFLLLFLLVVSKEQQLNSNERFHWKKENFFCLQWTAFFTFFAAWR